jgi:hydrogenase maturation protein HypF
MELEFAIQGISTDEAYSFRIREGALSAIDWEPMVLEILDDIREKVAIGQISAKFHNTLAEMIVAVAKRVGEERVLLTGGCFQNRYLTERTVDRLSTEGFRPYWHQRVPPNDGGIALGQAFAVLRKSAGKTVSAHTP